MMLTSPWESSTISPRRKFNSTLWPSKAKLHQWLSSIISQGQTCQYGLPSLQRLLCHTFTAPSPTTNLGETVYKRTRTLKLFHFSVRRAINKSICSQRIKLARSHSNWSPTGKLENSSLRRRTKYFFHFPLRIWNSAKKKTQFSNSWRLSDRSPLTYGWSSIGSSWRSIRKTCLCYWVSQPLQSLSDRWTSTSILTIIWSFPSTRKSPFCSLLRLELWSSIGLLIKNILRKNSWLRIMNSAKWDCKAKMK